MADEEHGAEGEHSGGHEEEKPEGFLETLINDMGDFWKWTKKGATVAGAAAITAVLPVTQRPTPIGFSLGQIVSNLMKEKPAYDGVLKQATVGSVLSYQLSGSFQAVNNLGDVVTRHYGQAAGTAAEIAAWNGVGLPAALTTNMALNKGIGEKFRKEYFPDIKKALYLAIPSTINILAPYSLFWKMLVSAGVSFSYRLTDTLHDGKGKIKNLFKAINPLPYAQATVSVAQKAVKNTASIAGGFFSALYEISSGVRTKVYGGQKESEPEPAHG